MTAKERAMWEICKIHYGSKGYRVSSVKETHDGSVIVRFPDGGPSGLKKTLLNPNTIQEIRKRLEG